MSTPKPVRILAPSENSTNDRFQRRALRVAFGVMEAVAPGLGGRVAERLFFRPPPSRASARVLSLLASARAFSVRFRGQALAAWSWGEGPRVILVHGWGSRGGHMGAFVPRLLAAGFSAVAFDAPAHGASPGRSTNIPEMAGALWAVAEATGAKPPAGAIAHSAGSVATAYAVRHGLALRAAVLLASAARPDTYAERFAERLGLGPRVQARLRARSETRLGLPWSALDVPVLARDLQVPALLVHDEGDPEAPWRDSAAIASSWPQARLMTTRGLGHHQLLRDPEVARRAVEFLSEGVADADRRESEEVVHAGR
jgi:pimeloyl-ACP methyl ester carboxylesterase